MITYFGISYCCKWFGKNKNTPLIFVALFAFAFVSSHSVCAQSGNTGGTLGKTNKSLSGSTKNIVSPVRKKVNPVKSVTKPQTISGCASYLTAHTWRWKLGEAVTFTPINSNQGTMRSSLNFGTWVCETSRTVTLRWRTFGFVDRLTVSPNGRTLSGVNNLGIALSFSSF